MAVPPTDAGARTAPDDAPPVRLGMLSDDSIAASVYVLVRHGASLRPALAAGLRGSVLLRFPGEYTPVRIEFRGTEIHVEDARHVEDRGHDVEIIGRLGDVNALIAAPLAGGIPTPTSARGRRALARLADGRVDFVGGLTLARKVLMLLALDPSAMAGPAASTRTLRRPRRHAG